MTNHTTSYTLVLRKLNKKIGPNSRPSDHSQAWVIIMGYLDDPAVDSDLISSIEHWASDNNMQIKQSTRTTFTKEEIPIGRTQSPQLSHRGIAERLPGRSMDQVKARWYYLGNRKPATPLWTDIKDQVSPTDTEPSTISGQLPGNSQNQVRGR